MSKKNKIKMFLIASATSTRGIVRVDYVDTCIAADSRINGTVRKRSGK